MTLSLSLNRYIYIIRSREEHKEIDRVLVIDLRFCLLKTSKNRKNRIYKRIECIYLKKSNCRISNIYNISELLKNLEGAHLL